MRFPRFVTPAAVAVATLVLAAPPATAADPVPDPDVLGFPGGLTCVGTTVSGIMRVRSSKFSAGRVQLMHNVGGKHFDKILATKDFIVTKGSVDYPFSMDVSAAPVETVNFVAFGTAGEGVNIDTAQSQGLRAAECTRAPVPDTTAPATQISLPPMPSTGWYADRVPVSFTATDNGSGVSRTYYSVDGGAVKEWTGVFDHTLGGSHTVSFWSVDVAGNVEDAKTQQIKVDTAAPTIIGERNPAANDAGWNNTAVTVSFACADKESGVAEAGCDPDTAVTDEGAGQSVTGRVTDNVGKTASTTVAGINIDTTAPQTTANQICNGDNGWCKGDAVTVDLTAEDQAALSGVKEIHYAVGGGKEEVASGDTAHVTVPLTPGAAKATVEYYAVDNAGNAEPKRQAEVKYDNVAPAISAAVLSGPEGDSGYYTGPVTVGFTCSDSLSGVASCPDPVVLKDDRADWEVTGEAKDKAGNRASTTLSGISIDATAPVVTVVGAKPSYTLGAPTNIRCTATDATSGVNGDGCRVTVTGGTGKGVGTFNYTATATDRAGNVQTVTGTYRVVYGWTGFLQPINDTAHQADREVSVFKAGSSVPVKFQLQNAAGEVVEGGSAQWMSPTKGSRITAPADNDPYQAPAVSGSTFTYDSKARQYVHTWSTKGLAAGYYYRIGVRLDDGQTYFVTIGLR